MFEGVSDQIHQFITPRATNSSLPLPHHHHHHNFPLHNNNNSSSPNFNFHPFDNSYQISLQPPPHILHPLLHNKNGENHQRDDDVVVENCNSLQVAMAENENERSSSSSLMDHHHHHHQWSNDEVLSLLRIRSNMENWFPDSTWEHVSRKLGEVGFRRSAEKCKEKFEEESRYFNNFNFNNNNKSGRFLSELYHQDQPLFHGGGEDQENKVLRKQEQEQEEEREREQEEEGGGVDSRNEKSSNSKSYKKKKKRMRSSKKEFEILKVFCEDIVKKMMVQQEEIHTKLLHNMLKREEEKISKEESWKKQQMERLHKELEVMANEQAIASDRQATIIEILNQITTSKNFSTFEAKKELKDLLQTMNNATSPSSSSLIQTQISSPTLANSPIMVLAHENSSSFTSQNDPKNPNPTPFIKNQTSFSIQKITQNPKSTNIEKEFDDLGKRWPRDEVLALVNVRCNLYGNGGDQENNGEGSSSSSKAPLWERISQGMLELGYKRSAKRCKEKWENINKYFRKTKDVNKKRSLDSRTCPYFHQLSTFYNQGGSNHVVPSTTASMKQPDNGLNSLENRSELSENVPTNAC